MNENDSFCFCSHGDINNTFPSNYDLNQTRPLNMTDPLNQPLEMNPNYKLTQCYKRTQMRHLFQQDILSDSEPRRL